MALLSVHPQDPIEHVRLDPVGPLEVAGALMALPLLLCGIPERKGPMAGINKHRGGQVA